MVTAMITKGKLTDGWLGVGDLPCHFQKIFHDVVVMLTARFFRMIICINYRHCKYLALKIKRYGKGADRVSGRFHDNTFQKQKAL